MSLHVKTYSSKKIPDNKTFCRAKLPKTGEAVSGQVFVSEVKTGTAWLWKSLKRGVLGPGGVSFILETFQSL